MQTCHTTGLPMLLMISLPLVVWGVLLVTLAVTYAALDWLLTI